MIKSPAPAEKLAVENPHQTNTMRVLCVCSVGMLRSPTLANLLHKEFGLNTRSCGVEVDYALVPISTALLKWADQIVFVDFSSYSTFINDDHNQAFLDSLKKVGTNVKVLSVPDDYDWNDKVLNDILLLQYRENYSE